MAPVALGTGGEVFAWCRQDGALERGDMRTINEQELKDIIDKHGKWIRNEEGGERANLSHANLSDADLSHANLSHANLSDADLSHADLRHADLRHADLMLFQFQRHQAYFTFDGSLRIGCEVMSVADWSTMYEGIGQAQGYTPEQIAAYGGFIKLCLEMFKARNQ